MTQHSPSDQVSVDLGDTTPAPAEATPTPPKNERPKVVFGAKRPPRGLPTATAPASTPPDTSATQIQTPQVDNGGEGSAPAPAQPTTRPRKPAGTKNSVQILPYVRPAIRELIDAERRSDPDATMAVMLLRALDLTDEEAVAAVAEADRSTTVYEATRTTRSYAAVTRRDPKHGVQISARLHPDTIAAIDDLVSYSGARDRSHLIDALFAAYFRRRNPSTN